MKKNLIFIFCVIFANLAIGIYAGATLTSEPLNKSLIKELDVSHLWTTSNFLSYHEGEVYPVERAQPLGYIGNDFQRFYIHFNTVEKNNSNPLKYQITGKTRVKENICSFDGVLNITNVVILPELYCDGENYLFQQGYLEGSYEFRENKDEYGAGVLKGTFRTNFYIDNEGKMLYDGLNQNHSDPFNNNQFTGTWTGYKTGAVKKCNWGDYRIPDSKGLNSGAAEFHPLNASEKNGWANYVKASYSNYNNAEREKAWAEESRQWWR